MPKYEVVEVIRKYWEVEANSGQEAYDLVMDGDPSAKLVDTDGETEDVKLLLGSQYCSDVTEVVETIQFRPRETND